MTQYPITSLEGTVMQFIKLRITDRFIVINSVGIKAHKFDFFCLFCLKKSIRFNNLKTEKL